MSLEKISDNYIKSQIDIYLNWKPMSCKEDILKKYIIMTLGEIKEVFKKLLFCENAEGAKNALNEVYNYFRENFNKKAKFSVGAVQEIIEKNFLDDYFPPKDVPLHIDEANQGDFDLAACDIASKNKLVD